MKQRLLIMLLLCTVFLVSCVPIIMGGGVRNNDWAYKLPNEYEIWHINSQEIICGKKDSEFSLSTVVDQYVLSFCYDTRYIGLQCVDESVDLSSDSSEENLQYYLIDSETDIVIGPLKHAEYMQQSAEMNLSSWIQTKPRPEGAVFE